MIEKELVYINASYTNQQDVLNVMIDKAKQLQFIDDKEVFIKAITDREELMPTSVGFKVAIPHGKSNVVKRAFVAFMKTSKEFIWNNKNGEQVDLVFMIGVPGKNENNLHLKCLSMISRKLMQDDFREALRNAKNADEAFHLLDEINNTIRES